MVYFYYIKNIYTQHVLFSFHSIKAVQQAVPLVATHINDKSLIMIRKK